MVSLRATIGRWCAPAALCASLAVAPAGAAAASGPIVSASVATKNGTLIGPIAVRAKQVQVKVDGRRCTVAAGTPLAALVALRAKAKQPRVGRIALKDYGTCGKRPSTSARLYLTGIGADTASGPDGWIYDVGGKGGSTSAADPAGPFGAGRLARAAEVSWRWCRASQDPEGDCGDAFVIAAIGEQDVQSTGGGTLLVKVQVRSGADGDQTGTLAPAPVGTTLSYVDPAGTTLTTGSVTDPAGFGTLTLPGFPKRGSRVVVSGTASTAPAGRLWPLFK